MAEKKGLTAYFIEKDPIGWITKAKAESASEGVKSKFEKLSTEGSSIHWLNLLRDFVEHLTFGKIYCSLGFRVREAEAHAI